MKLITQGAEAEIWQTKYNKKTAILKQRKDKKYREQAINDKIIPKRIKQEVRNMQKANSLGIKTPEIYSFNPEEKYIIMEYIKAKKLKEVIDIKKIKEVAEKIAKLHNNNIIHGDLTLQNILYDKEPIFIDFGLSFISTKIEDKVTDIFVFKETLIAEFNDELWNVFFEEYLKNINNKEETLKRYEKIEKRRKYM